MPDSRLLYFNTMNTNLRIFSNTRLAKKNLSISLRSSSSVIAYNAVGVSKTRRDLNNKKELVDCVKNLYWMGLTTSISGNHSVRFRNSWMWITPSGIPRYKIDSNHLVKVHLKTSKVFGNIRPSIELNLHRNIYNKRQDVNAIVHTHSPFTIGVSISSKFQHVIEEAKIVVGQPVIISTKSSKLTTNEFTLR
jgi:ribulose-5-phosphate 4-epimerase/fuculose-1-phosphate aldolase